EPPPAPRWRGAASSSACRSRTPAGVRRDRSRTLLFLAGDADTRPRDGVEPGFRDRLAAVATDPVSALFNPPERFLDGLEDLGVGLFQLELDVHFVVAARLIRHVALARVVLHRGLERLDAAGAEYLATLLEQRVLMWVRLFHRDPTS